MFRAQIFGAQTRPTVQNDTRSGLKNLIHTVIAFLFQKKTIIFQK